MIRVNERRDITGPLWVYVVALALFFLRFGYGYALGDQDEILPYLLRLLDPTLFETDWFVQTQVAGFSVRTYFVYLLFPLCRVIPIETVTGLLYLALWLTVAAGAYHLALTFELPRLSAAGAVVVGFGILHKWTLGSNDLVYSMLVPEMAAWALALPAVRFKLLGKNTLAAVLLGISAWFQILVGILVFGALLAEELWSLVRSHDDRRSWQSLLRQISVFLVAALPILVPILLQQLEAPVYNAEPSIFYILAPFRNSVHHMFLSFPFKSVARFTLLAFGAAVSLRWLARRELVAHGDFLLRLGSVVLVGSLVMIMFTEWIPVLFIAKLQAYKLTVLFKFLALALMGAVVVGFMRPGLVQFFDRFLVPGRLRMLALLGAVLICSLLGVLYPSMLTTRLSGSIHAASELGQMEQWIAANSERSALFAIPPSNSSFRSRAERGIVIDFMAFPYRDGDMIEWYSRIQAMAPVGMVESGMDVRTALDIAFEDLEADQLRRLAAEYGFEYVLRRNRVEGFDAVKTIGDWTLFRVT